MCAEDFLCKFYLLVSPNILICENVHVSKPSLNSIFSYILGNIKKTDANSKAILFGRCS